MSTTLSYENLDATIRTDITNLAKPTVTGITYSSGSVVSTRGGDTITVIGTNFLPSAQVYVGLKPALSVIVVSTTELTVTVPQNLPGSQLLSVVNTNGSVTKYPPGVQYAPGPYWITASGSLGSVNPVYVPSFTLLASSDSAITYTVTAGALPSGVTLNSSAGTFSGGAPAVETDTVYNFTVTATDAEGQTASRDFSMTVSTDVVYWSSPVQGQTLTYTAVGAITQINVAVTSKSGNAVSVAVSGLPAGLKYIPATNAGWSIGSIAGVPGVNGTYTVTLVATVATTGKQQTITITIVVNKANGQIVYETPGTYTWVCPTGVTSISLVLVGGGGGAESWGGGGGGGALTYTNNLAVTAGNSYTVNVGAGGDSFAQGGNTWFNTTAYISANGGKSGVAGNGNTGGGGGGAGGYTGAGGAGAVASTSYAGGAGGTSTGTARTTGFAGGAGGGGRSSNAACPVPAIPTITFGSGAGGAGGYGQCYGGGGVGLNGAISQSGTPYNVATVVGGDGGFSPNGGSAGLLVTGGQDSTGYGGGWPGGGSAALGSGAGGAVRIMWPGSSRTFPATNTMDM